MNANPESALYLNRLEARILRTLEGVSSSFTFCDLVERCDGAFPVDVLRTLESLRDSGQIPAHYARLQRKDSGISPSEKNPELPEPHPADFDWRFTSDTKRLVVERILTLTPPNGSVLLLGTPTLMIALQGMKVQPTLVDHNSKVIEALRRMGIKNLILGDIFEQLLLHDDSFDCAVVDPPWYPEHYAAGFEHAARALKLDGIALASVLPPLTRPLAVSDRSNLVRGALELGFDLVDATPQVLDYEVPPFERTVLAANGIDCGHWRHGDLFMFRKMANAPVAIERQIQPEHWTSFLVGGLQIKVRDHKTANHAFFVERIGSDEGLGTVSRRFERRSDINVWNSRNDAFQVSNTEPVIAALALMEAGEPAATALSTCQQQFELHENETAQLEKLLRTLLTGASVEKVQD